MARTGKELYGNIKLTTFTQNKILARAKRMGYKIYLLVSLESFSIPQVVEIKSNISKKGFVF